MKKFGGVLGCLLAITLVACTTSGRKPAPDHQPVLETLPAPSFATVPPSPAREASFEVLSTQPNQITDRDAWFSANNLVPKHSEPESAPAGIPRFWDGNNLIQVIHGSDSTLAVYGPDLSGGRLLIALDPETGAFKYGFDFSNFEQPPGVPENDLTAQRLLWAAEKDGTLYVSNSHRTYAKESGGQNAYLTAIDLGMGEIRWRTGPLIANASTFEVLNSVIVTGYGFTAEPDFVYLIDRESGAVVASQKVKSAPEIILAKDGKIFVRCYDTDVVLSAPDR